MHILICRKDKICFSIYYSIYALNIYNQNIEFAFKSSPDFKVSPFNRFKVNSSLTVLVKFVECDSYLLQRRHLELIV